MFGLLEITTAQYAAIVSSVLALIKLWETYRQRFRITVSYSFTSSPDLGNTITINNLNDKQLILEHYDIYWKKNKFSRTKRDIDISLEDPQNDPIRIPPHSFSKLEFTGWTHFDWGHAAKRKDKLFITLHIAGRRPKELLVYK